MKTRLERCIEYRKNVLDRRAELEQKVENQRQELLNKQQEFNARLKEYEEKWKKVEEALKGIGLIPTLSELTKLYNALKELWGL